MNYSNGFHDLFSHMHQVDSTVQAFKKRFVNAQHSIGVISVRQGIELMVFLAYAKDYNFAEIEHEKLISYCLDALKSLKSDLKSKNSILGIQVNKFGYIDKNDFLDELNSFNLSEIKTLEDWNQLDILLINHYIDTSKLLQLSSKLGLINKKITTSTSKKTVQNKVCEDLLMTVLNDIPEIERNELLSVTLGKKGLKSYVKNKIEAGEFLKYFNHTKHFDYIWNKVIKRFKKIR